MNKPALHSYTRTIDGKKIRFLEGGNGKIIFFLHGGGVEASTYKRLLVELAQHFRVVAPDLPGFGGSYTPNKGDSLQQIVDVMSKAIAEVATEDVILVGHSYGGKIAIELARTNQHVARAIIIDAASQSTHHTWQRFLWIVFVRKTLRDLVMYWNVWLIVKLGIDFSWNALRRLGHWSDIWATVYRIFETPITQIDGINMPILLLWGEKDELFPLTNAEQMAAHCPSATLNVMHGNHDWAIFRPALTAEKIRSWLQA